MTTIPAPFYEIRISNEQRELLCIALHDIAFLNLSMSDERCDEMQLLHDMLDAMKTEDQSWVDGKLIMNDFTA